MIKYVQRLIWSLIIILLSACSNDKLSPEDQIRQYIKTGVEAAEARNSGDLVELVHADYLDAKGYSRNQLEKIAKLYFFRHKNIHLFTRINEIDFLAPDEAQVSMHVAMAGTIIADVSVLSSLRARIYKFELSLVKTDEWLLQQARWEPAAIGDME